MKCSVPGCENEVKNKKSGLCSKHYMRLKRNGSPNLLTEAERDARKLEKEEEKVDERVVQLQSELKMLTADLKVYKAALEIACKQLKTLGYKPEEGIKSSIMKKARKKALM